MTLLCGAAALKTGCHGKCEKRDARMRTMGFWRKSSDPPVPLFLHGKKRVWLDEAGGYSAESPARAA